MIIVVALAVRAVLVVGPQGVTNRRPLPRAPRPARSRRPRACRRPRPRPSRTTTPAPTPSDSTEPAECPVGNPTARQPHPTDGRIHGGGLSFPKTAGFTPTEQQPYFTWAYDVAGQDRPVEEQWNSTYVVGALPTFDGFESPKQSAELVMDCTVSSGLYEGFTGRTDVSSTSIVVDKRKAWAILSEVRVDDPRVSVPGDTVVVIVVDTGSPESLAMFWACVPIGDNAALQQLEAVAGRLRVE